MIFFALPPGHRGSIEERIRERRDPETSEGVVQVEIRLELRAERRTGADRRSHPHPIARDNSGMSSSDAAQSSVNADARAFLLNSVARLREHEMSACTPTRRRSIWLATAAVAVTTSVVVVLLL
jgi:hypothetical protein